MQNRRYFGCTTTRNSIYLSSHSQKQFSDLFGLAAEDETSATVSRRGTSSRGRKAAPSKKESTSNSNSAGAKKNSKANNYSSEESSDVSQTFSVARSGAIKFLFVFLG